MRLLRRILKADNINLSDKTVKLSDGTEPVMLTPPPPDPEHERMREEANELLRLANEQAMAIIEEANGRAHEILQRASKDAREQADAMVSEARAMVDTIKNEAYDEGYIAGHEDGLQSQVTNITDEIERLSQSFEVLKSEREAFFREFEGTLEELAVSVAEKVLREHIDRDDMNMLPLVKAALDSARNSQIFSISVSEEMTGLIDHLVHNIEKYVPQTGHSTEVIPKELPKGGLLIETEHEIIDVSLYTQIENIKNNFKQI